MNEDVNVIVIVKGDEKYLFLYCDSQRSELMRRAGIFASNPDLSFSWYDAAVVSQTARRQAANDMPRVSFPLLPEP